MAEQNSIIQQAADTPAADVDISWVISTMVGGDINQVEIYKLMKRLAEEEQIGVVLLVLAVIAALVSPNFLTAYNLQSVVRDLSFVIIIAIGQSCLLMPGELDLAVWKMASLSGVIGGILMLHGNVPPYLALPVSLPCGLLLGVVNGLIITRLKLNAMMGLFCAIAGLLMIARLGNSQPAIGDVWVINSIAASVIGGVALTGGMGNPFGAAIGACILSIIQNHPGLAFHGRVIDERYRPPDGDRRCFPRTFLYPDLYDPPRLSQGQDFFAAVHAPGQEETQGGGAGAATGLKHQTVRGIDVYRRGHKPGGAVPEHHPKGVALRSIFG